MQIYIETLKDYVDESKLEFYINNQKYRAMQYMMAFPNVYAIGYGCLDTIKDYEGNVKKRLLDNAIIFRTEEDMNKSQKRHDEWCEWEEKPIYYTYLKSDFDKEIQKFQERLKTYYHDCI